MKRTWILALLVTVMAGASLAGAQTLTGTILGVITDEQGGVLPGVNVTLTGRTGSITQVTNAKGEYRFLALNPGTYSVRAEIQGFKPKEQQNIEVGVARTAQVDLSLQVGQLTETVNVVANAVTVDTRTTATDTNLAQDLLFNMPMMHANPAVNILQYVPGVSVGGEGSSAFGGAADSANSLMLDGVDTRDPSGGTAYAFWNYNIIEEVQVGALGQPAEYGGFTGAVVNTITKSGGNRNSFLSEMRYTSKSLSRNNAPDDVVAINPNLGTPIQVIKMTDYTVQLGGPMVRDKLFYFGSVQRYHVEQRYYPRTVRTENAPRFNFKFTYQATPNDTIIGSVQYDHYDQGGRTGAIPGWALTDQSQTRNEPSPEVIYNAQYRKVFGSSTFLEAKYLGWWGYYNLIPVSDQPTHYDGETGAYSGGAGYWSTHLRTRNQLNVALTKYARFAGTHSFKFGMEIERSKIRDQFTYVGGVYYYDSGGPYIAYGYSYDLRSKNSRESYYAQDQWKAGRFTTNIGVRADDNRGYGQTNGVKYYSTFSVAPRLGFALDLTGNGTSVVRAYYGRMYDAADNGDYSRALPGYTDTTYYDVGPNWSTLTPYDVVSGASKYTMGPNLKHPRMDEYNVAYEQRLGRSWKVATTFVHRSWANFLNSVLINGQWTQFNYTTKMGNVIPLYKWANSATVDQKFLIQNTDTVNYAIAGSNTPLTANAYRTYNGVMFVLDRSLSNRWQGQISYVRSLTKGTLSNGTYNGNYSTQFETPNLIVGMYDGPTSQNKTNVFKVFLGYQIPKIEVSANAYFVYASGAPYAAYERVSGSKFNWPSSISVNIDERGSSAPDPVTGKTVWQYTDPVKQVDLRLEKLFKYGMHRFGVYVDFQNLFNWAAVESYQSRYPSQSTTDFNGNPVTLYFGAPLALQDAFQATIGVRWSF